VAVVTLSTLLITAAPPAVAPTSDSGGAAAHAHAQAGLGPGSPAVYNAKVSGGRATSKPASVRGARLPTTLSDLSVVALLAERVGRLVA
jgi:hypothetical protein